MSATFANCKNITATIKTDLHSISAEQTDVLHFLRISDGASVVKNECGCFVVETNDAVFKIREIDPANVKNAFNDVVMQAFANEYSKMGLMWEYFSAIVGNKEYRIQKRQKLQVVSTCSNYEDVIIKASKVKRRVEAALEFPQIAHFLKKKDAFENVRKVVLARDCKADFSDYA